MANDWILDVLADLKTFASKNELPNLADGLDELALVATAELATASRSGPQVMERDTHHAGRVYTTYGSRRNAG